MTARNRDALAISDGACNPVAIVNSMVAAIVEMRAQPNFSGWDGAYDREIERAVDLLENLK